MSAALFEPAAPLPPHLRPALELLHAGLKLVPLVPYTKCPAGVNWNSPSSFVKYIDPNATGYGIPLAENKLCSVDPDNWDLAVIGLAACGFNIEEIMRAGVRTKSTRRGSGGRSTFSVDDRLAWVKFAAGGHGTILELRADSPNLQDCVPGVQYHDKEGNLCTQEYVSDRHFDDVPELPEDFCEWWARCSTDKHFLHEQQRIFFEAIEQEFGLSCQPVLSLSTGKHGMGGDLPFDAPGVRGPFNRLVPVEDILAYFGYVRDKRSGRWSPPNATGSPGVRPIPGKGGLWRSDHASDPLCGTFDAWTAYVVLEHGGDLDAASTAARALDFMQPSAGAKPAAHGKEPEVLPRVSAAPSDPASTTDDEADDLDIESLALPEFPDDALYGPLREIVERATKDSEATRAGVAAAAVAHLSVATMQPFCVRIGDDVVGLNLFVLLVGPSAKGRKGTSAALVEKRLMPVHRDLAKRSFMRLRNFEQYREAAEQELAKATAALESAEADLARAGDPPVKRDGYKYRIDSLKSEIAQMDDAIQARRAELPKKLGTPRAYDNAVEAIEKAELQLQVRRQALAEDERQLALLDESLTDRNAARARLTHEVEGARLKLERAKSRREAVRVDPIDGVLARMAEPPHRLPAVSSGEGIVAAIADPTVWPDGTQVVGTDDKRLLIDLPEFGGLLANCAREGSMTSAIIRDAYDGRDLATTGKHKPLQATRPHVCVFGNITGAELVRQLFDPRDRTANADNGFANRFVMSFSRRTKLVANPQLAAGVDDLAKAIWRNIERVYRALRPSGETWATPIPLSCEGLKEWERHYPRLTNREGSTERAKKLFGRLETNARKLAAVLAVINGEHEVSAEAVRAAVAWIEYSAATIDAVVATVEERRMHRALLADAEKVVDALSRVVGTALGWRDLGRATGLDRHRLELAVAHLAGVAPPRIRVGSREVEIGNGAVRRVSTVELMP